MSDKLKINILKKLGRITLNVNQTLPSKGITVIFGPSGSGKTSILKLLSGFMRPDSGIIQMNELWYDSKNKVNVPAYKRPIGYMFQDGRLFPHLNVLQNLEFAKKRASKAMPLDEIISVFELESLLSEYPSVLSGGETRRVALARTVLSAPEILFLDEPLIGLDRARKRSIIPFIENLVKKFDIPCFYVTHDIEEVCRLADHVMLLSSGRVKDFGSLDEILPQLDVATLDTDTKLSSLFSGMIISQDKEFSMINVDIGGAIIKVPGVSRRYSGKKIFIRINADDISIALVPPKKISIQNCIEAMIVGISVDVQSPYALVKARFSDLEITARITRAGVKSLKLTEGKTIYMLIKSVSFDSHL